MQLLQLSNVTTKKMSAHSRHITQPSTYRFETQTIPFVTFAMDNVHRNFGFSANFCSQAECLHRTHRWTKKTDRQLIHNVIYYDVRKIINAVKPAKMTSFGKPCQYVTNHPGQLSLAIPP